MARSLHLFLVQAGLGVALALSNPTWSVLYARYSPGEKQAGFAWGLVASSQNLILSATLRVRGRASGVPFRALILPDPRGLRRRRARPRPWARPV